MDSYSTLEYQYSICIASNLELNGTVEELNSTLITCDNDQLMYTNLYESCTMDLPTVQNDLQICSDARQFYSDTHETCVDAKGELDLIFESCIADNEDLVNGINECNGLK